MLEVIQSVESICIIAVALIGSSLQSAKITFFWSKIRKWEEKIVNAPQLVCKGKDVSSVKRKISLITDT